MNDISQTQFVAVRDVELAFIDVGEGPVMLFLHGFPFDKSMWDGQIEALSAAGESRDSEPQR